MLFQFRVLGSWLSWVFSLRAFLFSAIRSIPEYSATALQVRGVGVGCEVPHLRPVIRILQIVFVNAWVFYESAYTVLQGGLVLWYPLSPVATLWFVAIVPSSYLAGVIACFTDEPLAPSFRRHLARQIAANRRSYTIVKHLVWVTRTEPKASTC